MEMTKPMFKQFRSDFQAAVTELEKKYGIVLTMENISYTDTSFSAKVTGINGNSKKDAEKVAFNNAVWAVASYGLSEKDYGRKFSTPRGEFILVGVKPRSTKNPLVIRDVHGKEYKCSPRFVGLTK